MNIQTNTLAIEEFLSNNNINVINKNEIHVVKIEKIWSNDKSLPPVTSPTNMFEDYCYRWKIEEAQAQTISFHDKTQGECDPILIGKKKLYII